MSIINRVPKGWLGTLDAKTLGATPKETVPNLQPVQDITANYLADIPLEAATAIASFGSGSIGTVINTVTVPAGELWYVYGVAGSVIIGATGGAKYGFDLVVDTNTGVGAHFLTSSVVFAAAKVQFESNQRGITWNPPLLFGSGTSFGLWQNELWAAAYVCTTSILHRRVTV